MDKNEDRRRSKTTPTLEFGLNNHLKDWKSPIQLSTSQERILQGASVGQPKQRPTATSAVPTIPEQLEEGGPFNA
jgi:hypothetical protein